MCVRLVVHVPSYRVGDAGSLTKAMLNGQSCGGELEWRERVSLEGTGVRKAGRGRFLRGGGGVYEFRVRDRS